MKSHKNPPKVTLAQAIAGYMLNIQGRRLSPHTISDYRQNKRIPVRALRQTVPQVLSNPRVNPRQPAGR